MSASLVKHDVMEQVVAGGDLANLSSEQRTAYYMRVCESLGLNPATQPFQYIRLNGKLTLYARRDATEQLRRRDGVSVRITARESVNGVYVVTAQASTNGRVDESIGAVTIEGLKGEALSNAMMKAETKAKRRVTLSICGLGFLDESEVPANAEVVTSDGEVLAAGQLPAKPLTTIAEAARYAAEQVDWEKKITEWELKLSVASSSDSIDAVVKEIGELHPPKEIVDRIGPKGRSARERVKASNAPPNGQ